MLRKLLNKEPSINSVNISHINESCLDEASWITTPKELGLPIFGFVSKSNNLGLNLLKVEELKDKDYAEIKYIPPDQMSKLKEKILSGEKIPLDLMLKTSWINLTSYTDPDISLYKNYNNIIFKKIKANTVHIYGAKYHTELENISKLDKDNATGKCDSSISDIQSYASNKMKFKKVTIRSDLSTDFIKLIKKGEKDIQKINEDNTNAINYIEVLRYLVSEVIEKDNEFISPLQLKKLQAIKEMLVENVDSNRVNDARNRLTRGFSHILTNFINFEHEDIGVTLSTSAQEEIESLLIEPLKGPLCNTKNKL